jgi:hypothetical protein
LNMMRSACDARESSSRLASNKKPNTWKAMTTTNTKAECVPSFWKKWWNAFVRCFKREAVCTCSAERGSTAKVDEPRAPEKRAAAY